MCRIASYTNKVSRGDAYIPLCRLEVGRFLTPRGALWDLLGKQVLVLGMFLSRLTAFYWDLELHLHVDDTF